jgi:hypothetical protein
MIIEIDMDKNEMIDNNTVEVDMLMFDLLIQMNAKLKKFYLLFN